MTTETTDSSDIQIVRAYIGGAQRRHAELGTDPTTDPEQLRRVLADVPRLADVAEQLCLALERYIDDAAANVAWNLFVADALGAVEPAPADTTPLRLLPGGAA